MKHLRILAWAAAAFCLAMPLRAQVPGLINFQGKLLDLSNNPRNGSFSLTFRVFSAPTGGAALWSETQAGVNVANGVFAVQLGAVTPIPASVFAASPTYLEVQVGAEVGSPRQQLVATPYAFTAQNANNLVPGNANYVQVASSLQSGATFYVSSGTVAGPLAVGGALTTGSGAVAVTTASGFLDATKLSGTIPSAQLSGAYANALTLGNAGNSLAGDGTNLINVTAAHLLPGDTNYVQSRDTLQAGATFYVAKGTVGGPFTATGTVTLGGTAGVNDVTVASNLAVSGNLSVNGVGPQVLNGNVQVKGNGLLDSAGTNRITLGATNVVNGNLSAFSGAQLVISTNIAIVGANNNSDRYIAFPFTAGTAITARNVVVFTGPNQVGTSAFYGDSRAIGIAVTSAALGQTAWVATYGVVTGVVSDGLDTIVAGDAICSSATAGRATDGGASNSPVPGGSSRGCPGGTSYLGSAMTGAAATAGATFTLFVHMFLF
ncbi:MAG: DUF2190 family protein [Elusimicrobia bacterium]|nr:DUF2190 family protein [Elusimicrobiota bacterium]